MSHLDGQTASLRLFNEKVRELFELSFVKAISEPNAGVKISGKRREDGSFEVTSEVRGPSKEAIKAFVLTFRFFIQDNEKASLHNISALYDASNIDPQQKAFFQSARIAINNLLDSPNFFNLSINGVIPTNREIMDVFIYGGFAHANSDKYERYKEWISFPSTAAMLQVCFNMILGHILRALDYIAQVNENTINQLSEKHE